MSVGATGGGANDTHRRAHLPTADTDIMRSWNLYEALAVPLRRLQSTLETMVAESIEAEHGKTDSWIVQLRPGIEFHNGKTVTADDVDLLAAADPRPQEPEGRRGIASATSTSRASRR